MNEKDEGLKLAASLLDIKNLEKKLKKLQDEYQTALEVLEFYYERQQKHNGLRRKLRQFSDYLFDGHWKDSSRISKKFVDLFKGDRE